MEILLGLLSLWVVSLPVNRVPACPAKMVSDQVCVFTEANQIVAINSTPQPVKVVLQIERIENVELKYRHPFVEEIPPHTSRILIEYKIVAHERPYALDYQWGWSKL